MNLFVLSDNITESAEFHTDRHIVKMPTELVQMLSFNYHHKDLWNDNIPEFIMGYSKGHDKHPCTIWIRESLSNWKYAVEFGYALYDEYQFRYNQKDKHVRTKQILDFAYRNTPNIKDIGLTRFAEAMDECYRTTNNVVLNYRNYYNNGKKHLFDWKNRKKPYWIV